VWFSRCIINNVYVTCLFSDGGFENFPFPWNLFLSNQAKCTTSAKEMTRKKGFCDRFVIKALLSLFYGDFVAFVEIFYESCQDFSKSWHDSYIREGIEERSRGD
jgi:hypothetical protein